MKISAAILCVVLLCVNAAPERGSPKARCTRDQMKAIAACADGVKPTKDAASGCPTCVPMPFDGVKCTKSKTKSCAKPAACASGVEPKRDGCCISCVPAKTPKCTNEQKKACKDSIATLSECPASADPKSVFDADTCCMTCKRPARPKPEAKCSKDDFKTCIDAAPECGASEKPLREKGQCCVSCRRPARDVPLRTVAKCAAVSECEGDEKPTRVKDDSGAFSCPSCKPPKPVCAIACGTKQKCVRSKKKLEKGEDTSTEGECKNKKVKKLKMKAKSAADKAFLKDATADEIKAALQEIVDRFCDKEDNAEKCDKFQKALTDGMSVKIEKVKNDETDVQVEIPDVEAASVRRRLADDTSSLLDAALADPDATGDIQVSDNTDTDTGNTDVDVGNSASSLSVNACAILLVCGTMASILG